MIVTPQTSEMLAKAAKPSSELPSSEHHLRIAEGFQTIFDDDAKPAVRSAALTKLLAAIVFCVAIGAGIAWSAL